MIPLGVLQGTFSDNVRCTFILHSHVLGGLYDYPSAPDWDHYVDQSNNPKVYVHLR